MVEKLKPVDIPSGYIISLPPGVYTAVRGETSILIDLTTKMKVSGLGYTFKRLDTEPEEDNNDGRVAA